MRADRKASRPRSAHVGGMMMDLQVEADPSARVGALLRSTRLQAGLDVRDVARSLRIRRTYLEAIETGQFQVFPAPVYALGFVRAYARQLGLDADEIARRFRAELAGSSSVAPLHFPSPLAESGAPKGAVLLLGAAIAIGAYTAWYLTSGHPANVAQIVAPVPDRLEELVKEREIATPTIGTQTPIDRPPQPAATHELDVASVGDNRAASAAAPAASAQPGQLTAPPESWSADSIASALPAPVQEGAAPIAAAGSSAVTAMAAEPPSAIVTPGDSAGRIVLKAKADSWVEVRDPAGNGTLVARLLRTGDVYRIPDRPGLKLVTGNAGGLIVVVDGQVAPPLGKDGVVRRGIPLDPEWLRKGAEPLGSP